MAQMALSLMLDELKIISASLKSLVVSVSSDFNDSNQKSSSDVNGVAPSHTGSEEAVSSNIFSFVPNRTDTSLNRMEPAATTTDFTTEYICSARLVLANLEQLISCVRGLLMNAHIYSTDCQTWVRERYLNPLCELCLADTQNRDNFTQGILKTRKESSRLPHPWFPHPWKESSRFPWFTAPTSTGGVNNETSSGSDRISYSQIAASAEGVDNGKDDGRNERNAQELMLQQQVKVSMNSNVLSLVFLHRL